jgi:hypothetical protein
MITTRLHTRSLVALLAVGSLGLAACGSDDAGDELPTPAPAEQPADEPADEPADDAPADEPAVEGDVIGTANIGGTIVDPKPHPIDDIAIAESYPEQLMVQFTSGDANCLAATATATASGDEVVVSLVVGITEDAMSKSCVAGDVQHTLNVALDEGLDGRSVVAADA